jgi:hypothetical protein
VLVEAATNAEAACAASGEAAAGGAAVLSRLAPPIQLISGPPGGNSIHSLIATISLISLRKTFAALSMRLTGGPGVGLGRVAGALRCIQCVKHCWGAAAWACWLKPTHPVPTLPLSGRGPLLARVPHRKSGNARTRMRVGVVGFAGACLAIECTLFAGLPYTSPWQPFGPGRPSKSKLGP